MFCRPLLQPCLASKLKVTSQLAVGQSVSMSWYRAPFGTCDQILFPVGMLLFEICGLVSMGAHSDERTGLQFVV
jgi:hypothetical protein